MRAHLPAAEIDSAGTSDWHIGSPPYGPAIDAAAKRGYDLSPQRARQIRRADFYAFDLVLAMDASNLADLARLAPADATATIALFRAPVDSADVTDPYYTRDFEAALDLVEEAAAAWALQPHISSATSPKAM